MSDDEAPDPIDWLLNWHATLPANRLPSRDGAFIYERLLEQDSVLMQHGFPPLSDWWRETLREFYCSEQQWRWLVLRVGRRGGKSSSLCRVAVAEAMHGNQHIPPGDVGYWAFISVSREEAGARLVTIKAILDALGEEYEPVESGIRIKGRNRGFKVVPATIAGVSGFTSIGFTCDEMTKWRDKDSGANPAKEVVKSLKPTIAGMRHARGVFSSSPFSTLDLHYEMYEEGTTDKQFCAGAPTWIARPTLTEAETRELEDDEETWLREYGNEPMGSAESDFFDASVVDACVDRALEMPVPRQVGQRAVAGADFAFERNASALAITWSSGIDAAQRWILADLRELKPNPGEPLLPSYVVGEFARVLASHGVPSVIADQHYRMAVVEHLMAHQLLYYDAPAGQSGKADTYVRARVLMRERRLVIPSRPDVSSRLVKQLKQVRCRPTSAGGLTITQQTDPSGRHGDLVSALVLAVWQRHGDALQPPAEQLTHAQQVNAEAAAEKRRVFDVQNKLNMQAARRMMRLR